MRENTLDIDYVIAMAKVIDQMDGFDEEYKHLVSTYGHKKVKEELSWLSGTKEQYKRIDKEIGTFFGRYKKVLDTIQETGTVEGFLLRYYDKNGNHNENYSGTTFYHYLKQHQDEKDKILDNLNGIKASGYSTVTLEPGKDYSKTEHHMSASLFANSEISYGESFEILDKSDHYEVYYRVKTPYLAILSDQFTRKKSPRLMVSTLTMDRDILPKTSTIEGAFDRIMIEKEQGFASEQQLENVLAFYENTAALSTAINNLIAITESDETVPDRARTLQTLGDLKRRVVNVKQARSSYVEQLIDTNPDITREEVEAGKDAIKAEVRSHIYRPRRNS